MDNSNKYKDIVFKIGQSHVEGLFQILLWGSLAYGFFRMFLEDVTSTNQRLLLVIEMIFEQLMIQWQMRNLYNNPQLFITINSVLTILSGITITEIEIIVSPKDFLMSSMYEFSK